MKTNDILSLLGSVVSFDYQTLSKDVSHTESVKGLVIAVSIELNDRHALSIRDYEDREDSFEISRMTNFKATQLDPYAFFENIKNGNIEIVL